MKKSSMSATKLRATLSTFVVLIIVIIGVGFYFTYDFLTKQAAEVNSIVLTSTAGSGNSESVAELQKAIKDMQPAIAKANAIITPSTSYTEQIISDLNKIAEQSGVLIADYSFADGATAGATGTPAPTSISGVQVKSATVKIASPVEYSSLLKFLQLIETNLPKMQISGITVARDTSSSSTVTVQPLTVEVYTR